MTRQLRAVDVTEYERATCATPYVCDVPPVFKVRLHCPDAGEAEDLLEFLRRDGIFAYPVGDAIEAVAAESERLDAPRELIGRVVDWFERTDAALAVSAA
jgi:hypothetical protein